MRSHFFIPLILLLQFFSSSLAMAMSPDEEFAAGTSAFRAGDYALALEHFMRAEDAGMRDARLDYNLGSVLYRLGQFDRSRDYFDRLRGHPMLGASAYYNLGLIAHKQGNRNIAIDWFEACIAASEDPELRELARRQIDRLGGRRASRGFAYLSTVYGYDSNITLLPSSGAAGESGDFVQALALGEWSPGKVEDEGVYLSFLLLATDYLDGDDFDDDLLLLGGEYRQRAGDWHLGYGLDFSTSTFAGEDFTDTSALVLNARSEFADDRRLYLQLTLEDVSEGSQDFAYLDGSRTEFAASWRIDSGPREYRFEYGFEINDRENTETESFSPTHQRIRLRYFERVTPAARLGASFEFRDSDYRGVPGDDRRDERARLRLEGNYDFNPTWSTQAEVTYTDNDSTDEESAYHKYQARVSVNLLF